MANQQQISTRPWILELVPLLVVILIAVHVIALVSYGETAPKKKEALEAVQSAEIEKPIAQ